jgi:hypothetical protein
MPVDPNSVTEWRKYRLQLTLENYKFYLNKPDIAELERTTGPKQVHENYLPPTFTCNPSAFARVGGGGDGGKWFCSEFFEVTPDCAIFSIGSNGDFSFEQEILKHTQSKCEVHTFDCTGTWPSPDPKIHFHPWCIADKDFVDGETQRIYKTYSTMIKELKLTRVNYLKIDVEGYEWTVIPSLLDHERVKELPRQIALEMHLFPTNWFQQPKDVLPEYNFIGNTSFLRPTLRFFSKLAQSGYHIASWEYNHQSISECCGEFVLIRTD